MAVAPPPPVCCVVGVAVDAEADEDEADPPKESDCRSSDIRDVVVVVVPCCWDNEVDLSTGFSSASTF